MNRGILAIGIAGIVLTVANVFASIIFMALMCFDTCPPVLSSIQYAPWTMLLYFAGLVPALGVILGGWIWQLRELGRMGARTLRVFVATFPLIAVVVIASVTFIAAASAGVAPLNFTPMHLWSGEFGLVLWPLLVSIVAFARRQRVGGPAADPALPPTPTSPTA